MEEGKRVTHLSFNPRHKNRQYVLKYHYNKVVILWNPANIFKTLTKMNFSHKHQDIIH